MNSINQTDKPLVQVQSCACEKVNDGICMSLCIMDKRERSEALKSIFRDHPPVEEKTVEIEFKFK